MEDRDFLRLDDKVTVAIYGPDGNCLSKTESTGYHNLETVVKESFANSGIDIDPKDCVFEITNQTTGVTHRYRLNAHGNLKLII